MTSTVARLTRRDAGTLIELLGEQGRLPDLHPHFLRHGFVTRALYESARCATSQTPQSTPNGAPPAGTTGTATAATATPRIASSVS